ncbi:hypothetical protein F2Q68_00004886 [Brassica cretica]|uniref:Uncharacterized protein n=1 Tax=Brassica cretica TaxID=69181 RepID=A0A8S9JGT8_BRACR|nr:hypothetical protein F2Q68_00004886 [Brassica cretica]
MLIKLRKIEYYTRGCVAPRVYLVLVLFCENLVVVLVVIYRSLLPQMPPTSPTEDRGTAIPIEDRDQAIPERLRLILIVELPVLLVSGLGLEWRVTSRKDHSAREIVGSGVVIDHGFYPLLPMVYNIRYARVTEEWLVFLARGSCREEERMSIDAELLTSIDMDARMQAEHIL